MVVFFTEVLLSARQKLLTEAAFACFDWKSTQSFYWKSTYGFQWKEARCYDLNPYILIIRSQRLVITGRPHVAENLNPHVVIVRSPHLVINGGWWGEAPMVAGVGGSGGTREQVVRESK